MHLRCWRPCWGGGGNCLFLFPYKDFQTTFMNTLELLISLLFIDSILKFALNYELDPCSMMYGCEEKHPYFHVPY